MAASRSLAGPRSHGEARGAATVVEETVVITYREALPEDEDGMHAVDGSFRTDTVFEAHVTEDGVRLQATTVAPPIHKIFPPDTEPAGADDGTARTYVALDGDRVCGFVVTRYHSWNRRLTIADIEVSASHRRRGVGRGLMDRAVNVAREYGAGHVWLEVSNVNAPAVLAYRRMGFTLCGVDTSLYEGTESAGEWAIFMSKPCA